MSSRIPLFDYMKGFLAVLVVLHHSFLAYVEFIEYDSQELIASLLPASNLVNPVVDEASWIGFDIIVGINDVYFMSAFFLLSGLFFYSSLQLRGTTKFLTERFVRLGIPFIVGIFLLVPLAFYTAHLQSLGSLSFFSFWTAFVGTGFPTSGHMWFLWLLLLFNLLAVLIFSFANIKAIKSWKFLSHPWKLFMFFLLLSQVGYQLMRSIFPADVLLGFGPFEVQSSRLLHYFFFFLIGVLLGIYGVKKTGLLSTSIQQAVPFLLLLGVASFVYSFPLACTCLVFSFFGFFSQNKKTIPILASLGACSFGIYLFHNLFASWMQYFLLGVPLIAQIKGILVFVVALGMSWSLTAFLRRNRALRAVL